MHPDLFSIGGFVVHTYGVCIAVGFLLSLLLCMRLRKHAGMTKDQVSDVCIIAIVSGFLGARLLYILLHWESLNHAFAELFNFRKPGFVFYGGFILAILCVMFYAKRKGISILALLDVLGPAIALAHAFGRIGCLMAGCCFGAPAPSWAVPFATVFPPKSMPALAHPALSGSSLPLYPTQILECVLNLIVCLALCLILKKTKRRGVSAGLYLLGYAVMRFLLELLRGDVRGDHTITFTGLSPSQNIALFLMLPAGLAVLVYAFSGRNEEKADHGETR